MKNYSLQQSFSALPSLDNNLSIRGGYSSSLDYWNKYSCLQNSTELLNYNKEFNNSKNIFLKSINFLIKLFLIVSTIIVSNCRTCVSTVTNITLFKNTSIKQSLKRFINKNNKIFNIDHISTLRNMKRKGLLLLNSTTKVFSLSKTNNAYLRNESSKAVKNNLIALKI